MKLYNFFFASLITLSSAAQTIGPAPSTYFEPRPDDSSSLLNTLLRANDTPLLLESGDTLSIGLYGIEAYKARVRINPDGSVDLPLAGRIDLAGLTVEKAQLAIAELFRSKDLVLSPAVMIDVVDAPHHIITVSGEVKSPGSYPAFTHRTLTEVLGNAGGLNKDASNVVVLMRPSLPAPVNIPIGPDPNNQPYASLPIFAGDEIRVPHVGVAYILGAVKKPGSILLKNFAPTTVIEAIAQAEGMGYEAAANDAQLVRTQGTKRIKVTVAVAKILKGKVQDIPLQNDDILYIPTNQSKAAIKGGAASLIVSLANSYIFATH